MSRDALVVGINYYEDKTLQLTAPVEDAKAIAQRLQQDGNFKVRTLLATAKIVEFSSPNLKMHWFDCSNRAVTKFQILLYFTSLGMACKRIKAFLKGF
jgi:predicted ABC-type ATPase